METKSIKILSVLFLVSVNLTVLSGQEKISSSCQISYLKNTDNQRYLKASLTYSKNRMELPIPGMNVSFYTGKDKKILLQTSTTDNKGIAEIMLDNDPEIPEAKDGSWSFSSEFGGNDTIEVSSSEIDVTDVILEMDLASVDTIKTISVKATKVSGSKKSPAGGETVIIYVPRMFSLLPVGEITLDDSGAGSLEFPSDLPGDEKGNITVIAKFENNPTFGNVEKREILRWGLPSGYSVPSTHRALWTKGAPKWMIYTLSILLAGVWGHYLFAIISLIRIKLQAGKEAKKERYEL
ncbi:MAG: hypothetical protein ACM3RX_10375 [Methanococcaceae archaeon]